MGPRGRNWNLLWRGRWGCLRVTRKVWPDRSLPGLLHARPDAEPPLMMRDGNRIKNALSVAAEFDALTADRLGNEIGVGGNRLPEKTSFEQRNTIEFSRTENPPVLFEFAVAVALELLVYRAKGQQSLGNIRKHQSWMSIFEVFKMLELIAANNLNRSFRKLIALRPQDVPTRFRLIDEIHQSLAQNKSIRFDMDDLVGPQGFGNLDGMQKAAPPAWISLHILPPQVVIEADDEVFIFIRCQRCIMRQHIDAIARW